MPQSWKPNWAQTREHFSGWWQQRGLVVGAWGGISASEPHAELPPPEPVSPAAPRFYTDAAARARRNHYLLSRQDFPLDMIPSADCMIGPGSLALCLGSEPVFDGSTVWFAPTMDPEEVPERTRPLRFDPDNRWWRVHEASLRECVALAGDRYLVGCPDLVENIDVLASLRGLDSLFIDMIEHPDWVSMRLDEINRAYFEVYDRIYTIIRQQDGGAVFEAYKLWGPGKTAKVQCDAAAMFSPEMFRRFVVPALREQCAYLDYSMYHLDGGEQFRHLDALLEIEELDAIEWTPNAGMPLGGDPRWYDLYRRILAAGKSVQVYFAHPHEIEPLLDAIGHRGVYVLGLFRNRKEVDAVARQIEAYR